MSSVDERLIGLAFAWLTLGLSADILAKIMELAWLAAFSHSALSLAFPVMAFSGLVYRFFPLMKQSKLVNPQVWMLGTGLALVAAGEAMQAANGNGDIAGFARVFVLGGAVLQAVIWWQDRAPRR